MSHEQDWQEFRDAIRITREIMNQPALDKYRGREISPGIECQSDAELDEFVRNHAETAFHPCGTCKMGYDEQHRDVLCRWRRAGSPLTGQCRAATTPCPAYPEAM